MDNITNLNKLKISLFVVIIIISLLSRLFFSSSESLNSDANLFHLRLWNTQSNRIMPSIFMKNISLIQIWIHHQNHLLQKPSMYSGICHILLFLCNLKFEIHKLYLRSHTTHCNSVTF